jgi:hypothetical protein
MVPLILVSTSYTNRLKEVHTRSHSEPLCAAAFSQKSFRLSTSQLARFSLRYWIISELT